MIFGIGVDVIDIDRIQKAYEKKAKFADRILTDGELKIFNKLANSRKYEFLAGRFASKEAFSKAMGTGIGKVGFLDIEILKDTETGKPYVNESPFDGKVFISISHTATIAFAQVILEK